MANLRQVRSRIKSVQNTQKITRAMQMVAGAKLRRAQEQLFQARPYADRLEAITQRFLKAAPNLSHPLLQGPVAPVSDSTAENEVVVEAPEALVWVGSDTGLCGSYNEKLFSKTRLFMSEHKAVVIPIGRKALNAARRSGWTVFSQYTDLGGKVTLQFIKELSDKLIAAYQAGQIKNVTVLYTAFQSALVWKPTYNTWLPLIPPTQDPEDAKWQEKWIWEPPAEEIAGQLLPTFATAKLRRLLLEAFTSEHSARMVAMKSATDNASQMIDTLTLLRNKVRQASITKEIAEISAGAEALKQ